MEKQQFKSIIQTEIMLKRKFHSPSADWLKSALLINGRREHIAARGQGLGNLGYRQIFHQHGIWARE